jgi:hypothetical protein
MEIELEFKRKEAEMKTKIAEDQAALKNRLWAEGVKDKAAEKRVEKKDESKKNSR